MNAKAILDLFTEKDGIRISLAMPQRANGYLYASNGRMAVRIDDDPTVDCAQNDGNKRFIDLPPGVERLLSSVKEYDNFQPFVVPEAEKEKCRECDGHGHFCRCEECNGDGEFWHGSHLYECKHCDGGGEIPSTSGTDCETCGATGQIEKNVRVMGLMFVPDQIMAIASLPGVEMAVSDQSHAANFRFNGGVGVIMPVNDRF